MCETLNPFLSDGTWLRCGLHAHTTNSGGELASDKLAGHYEWAGYDVRAEEPSREAVLGALGTGAFYSSTGAEIRGVDPDERTVVVHCSPAVSVTLFAGRRRGARVNAGRLGYPHRGRAPERTDDGLITAVELRRPRGAPYGRIEVADPAGGRAWTNPLWI